MSSDAKVWLTQDLAERIRSVLEPMFEHYSALASDIGSDPDRQIERAHHVGRAQGLVDAIHALAPPTATDVEPGHVTADVVRRMRHNAGPARHRAQS